MECLIINYFKSRGNNYCIFRNIWFQLFIHDKPILNINNIALHGITSYSGWLSNDLRCF